MRNSTVIGRAAALAAVAIAIVVVAVIVLSGGTSYQVKAIFQNAGQIVSGDLVEVSGNSIGTVSSIALTPTGQAQLTLDISDKSYQPLRKDTLATVRQASLSGIANRYIDLRLGPGSGPTIPNGGIIPSQDTASAVDLDQLFNTLDAPTRKGLQDVFQGSASQYSGRGAQAQAAWQYLNPAIASSSMLFQEINKDTGNFTNFIVKSANLVSDIAQRSTDLSGLIQHLSTTTQALAAQRTALSESIQRLPGFMQLANTTFVNLRRALDELKPLVDVSKPVAPKLQKLLVQLKPLAINSVPTVRDLSNIICSAQHRAVGCANPGPNNDLIDLLRLAVPLAAVTCGTGTGSGTCQGNVQANGAARPGAFPVSTTALNNSTPELATARPYAVDLTGWFEGFSHPGFSDANGNASRVAAQLSLTSLPLSTVNTLLNSILGLLPGQVTQILNQLTTQLSSAGLTIGQGDRCPGSMERGALYYPQSGYPCNPSQVPTGP